MLRNPALITPSVIKWAREKSHYSPKDASKKVGVSPEKLREWESGGASSKIQPFLSVLYETSSRKESFTKIVAYSYKEGFISGRDASNLLDMKLSRMEKIISMLA